jgi:hypothetical protein
VLSEPRYLLIIACSQRKRSDPGLLPAIERYDGVNFRVLRKARQEGYWPENLDVLILSAKYGLIEVGTPIAYYEQRMTSKRAITLNAQILERMRSFIARGGYSEVYIDLGRDYLPAIRGCAEAFSGLRVIYAKGRIGERLKGLRDWLKAKYEE